MSSDGPVQINSEAIKTVEEKIVNIINNGYITYIQNGGSAGGASTLTPSTISALDNVNIKGTCKLVDNKVLNASGNEITFPSSTSTLATTNDIPTDYVKTTTNQIIGGVKTFSSAPKLSTNTLTSSGGYTITIPNTTTALVGTSNTQTLTSKTLTEPVISKIKNGDYTLTVPSKTGTLATTADIPTDYVKTTTNQIIEGIKTFSSAPKLSTNTLTTSSGYTVSISDATATMATTATTQTLSNKTLDASVKLGSANTLQTNSGGTITFPSSTATLATSSDISSLSTSISSIQSTLDTIDSRVDGANPALVFDTQAAMNTWLSNSSNTATLKTGQNLYIRELNVPDCWWDGSKACELETAKVDLSNYVSLSGTQTLTNKTLTSPTISSIKNGSYTLTMPSKSATLATTSDCVLLSGDQTVAGTKTFSSAPKLSTNTLKTSSDYTITIPNSTATVATLTGTETLTNKTLTTPTISSIKNGSYTLTLPSKTGTLATTADISSSSSGGSTTNELNLESQILYLSTRLEAALMYLSEKNYPRIKTICDEVCAAATVNKAK